MPPPPTKRRRKDSGTTVPKALDALFKPQPTPVETRVVEALQSKLNRLETESLLLHWMIIEALKTPRQKDENAIDRLRHIIYRRPEKATRAQCVRLLNHFHSLDRAYQRLISACRVSEQIKHDGTDALAKRYRRLLKKVRSDADFEVETAMYMANQDAETDKGEEDVQRVMDLAYRSSDDEGEQQRNTPLPVRDLEDVEL